MRLKVLTHLSATVHYGELNLFEDYIEEQAKKKCSQQTVQSSQDNLDEGIAFQVEMICSVTQRYLCASYTVIENSYLYGTSPGRSRSFCTLHSSECYCLYAVSSYHTLLIYIVHHAPTISACYSFPASAKGFFTSSPGPLRVQTSSQFGFVFSAFSFSAYRSCIKRSLTSGPE